MSRIEVRIDDQVFEVELDLAHSRADRILAKVDGQAVRAAVPHLEAPVEEMEWVIVDDRPYEIILDRDLHWLRAGNGIHAIEIRDLEALVPRPRSGDGRVLAPIPGQITRVMVVEGNRVEAGDPLLVLEAMKMENEIRAPRGGRVAAVNVAAGQVVALNEVLAEIT